MQLFKKYGLVKDPRLAVENSWKRLIYCQDLKIFLFSHILRFLIDTMFGYLLEVFINYKRLLQLQIQLPALVDAL